MKKRVGIIGTAVITVAGVISVPFLTNSEELDTVSPEAFVKEYVELGKAENYERIVDLVVDERFKNDRGIKLETYKAMQENLPSLVDYEIKEVKNVTEDQATVVVVLEYEDGSAEQAPLNLVKKDGDWKLYLDSQSALTDEAYKQISPADDI
ncbi:DUF4878 domain-containing protein [Planococcus salinus]|uniref:DUF4878 domain-containing protein n=1 Tax=Planococcus salinus TaxID=1848460 RepID=A0A3M8P624_9BACL|nr:DUF4878 domain-containing protein [Planococcus salinus]RNF39129.1 DUF4878 domain-containing protein [Planococcus salinus]